MMMMQRSSSLPGPAHASPPVSPTITQVSSRSPTPSPPEKRSKPHHTRRNQSKSPARFPSPTPRRDRKDTETTRPIESSASQPPPAQTSNTEPTNSKPRVPQLPLLQDLSQYVNTNLRDGFRETASTTLDELAHLARLSTYQERKRAHSRLRLQRSLVFTALSSRLARCGELSHRTLVDNFRADEKRNFATLYNAIHDVRNSCDVTRRYALLEPDLDIGGAKLDKDDGSSSFTTFIHEIPARSRETLFHFLSQIRTNPDFLATRLANLTPTELSALTIFHQGLEPVDSVLPFHNSSKSRTSSSNRHSANIPSAVERLLSFQRHDPLSALIHTCFANTGPDSNEDIKRTEIWASGCARLITESKGGTDPFICCVLNVWTTMRDWPGRSNMEWFLMKILEDGAFLLERAEELGTRGHGEPRKAKDSIAAEEFYDGAVRGLFELVDDPESGVIPEGLVELGNAILRKLEPRRLGPTRRFLVAKWLFSVFLLNVIIHPESYGMMSEYHVTEYGRQKILKEVIMRSQRLVVDMTWKQASPPPEIKAHIEGILGRFRTNRPTRTKPKLLPARSITSLRETTEVHPYLVVSPADLVTLVNALFPDRRPNSGSFENVNGLRSAASSVSGVSGISMPLSMGPPRAALDNASVVSNSGSSVLSDLTTSREPLLDDTMSSVSQGNRLSSYEDEGYKLKYALQEMTHALGLDVVSGSCHPCAERWAVLFMSPDGQSLSPQMLHDIDDDGEEEDTTSSDDEDNDYRTRTDLDTDYHQLRDSILKLLEDYEIPQTQESRFGPKTFSNRTTLEGARKLRRKKSNISAVSLSPQSKNPYRNLDLMTASKARMERRPSQSDKEQKTVEAVEEQPLLITMLEAAERQCQAQSDFVNAHLYFKTLQQLHQISSQTLKQDGYAELLNILSRGPRDLIRRSASAVEEYDAWLVWLKQSQERHDVTIENMMKRLRSLRDKMWYVTDVKNSAAYEGARNIAMALKSMSTTKPNKQLPTATRPRSIARSTTNNYLLRTEAQVIDMISASDEHGGPNKLSDDQSEKTARWLSQFNIENFCQGEERIHRFCLEVETCINKLVGDNLLEGPVLWSSELYYRDKRNLDGGRNKGDLLVGGMGALSVSDDGDHEGSDKGRKSSDYLHTGRSSHRDLRAISTRNLSQQSFDSGRWSMSRASAPADLMDAQDYFGLASPVLTIDSGATFWSPFQTGSQSPTTSISSNRPTTSSSMSGTVMYRNGDSPSTAKQRFLIELKQTLTSLILSDLGTLLFARGSETDSWFSGDLGEECFERKEKLERKNRRKKKRALEKKKSFRDLRSAQRSEPSDTQEAHDEKTEKGGSTSRSASDGHTPEISGIVDNSSASEALTSTSHRTISKEAESLEFPYRATFRRLLRMFSVHPNPYAKLNALYELEHLIVASIVSAPQKSRHRREMPAVPDPPTTNVADFSRSISTTLAQAKNLDEAIDNCKERRSHILHSPDSSPYQTKRGSDGRLSNAPSHATTDMIVEVLQDLFRSASMRPKTLFRDLQYIASFVPAPILDKSERGKAFWDAALAALGLKQDVCRTLIEIADEIVVHYTQTRQTSASHQSTLSSSTTDSTVSTMSRDSTSTTASTNTSVSSAGSNHSTSASGSTPQTASQAQSRAHSPPLMRHSLSDAARILIITAKEGDPVAERELAIFYLTHPELVPLTTLPLSKPKDTFALKAQVMADVGGGQPGSGKGERNDPATMCVAYHWMEASARGGDELAKKYLRQREELNAIG